MKLKLDITPDLVAMIAAEIKAGERAVSQAVTEAGNSVKSSWRAQITGAGLGHHPLRAVPERQTQPQRGGGDLVQGPGHHRRP